MKKTVYISMLFYCAMAISCVHTDKNQSKFTQKPNAEKVVRIKAETIDTLAYTNVLGKYLDSVNNHLKDLVLKKEDVLGGSTEGGEVYVYSNKVDTIKMNAIFYGEMGKNECSIYFKNKELIIFKEKMTYYKSQVGKKPIQIDSVTKRLFFLNHGKVISAKDEDGKFIRGDFKQKSIDIKQIYKEIMQQIRE